MNTWILMCLKCAMHLIEVQGGVYWMIICVRKVMMMRIIKCSIRTGDFFILSGI